MAGVGCRLAAARGKVFRLGYMSAGGPMTAGAVAAINGEEGLGTSLERKRRQTGRLCSAQGGGFVLCALEVPLILDQHEMA